MLSRKSCRQRTLTPKVKEIEQEKTNRTVTAARKRKLAPIDGSPTESNLPYPKKSKSMSEPPKDDKIDPVEKLLCLTNMDNDILMNLDLESTYSAGTSLDSPSSPSSETSSSPQLSLKVKSLITENLRSYYSSLCKSPIEIHNDNSSFSILNKKPSEAKQQDSTDTFTKKQQEVPFFKNVNFNPKSTTGDSVDDYIYYDDEEESDTSSDSEHESEHLLPSDCKLVTMPLFPSKMSFHYRHNESLTLSLNDDNRCCSDSSHDVSKILNSNSMMTGKASEMVGASRLLINDYFL